MSAEKRGEGKPPGFTVSDRRGFSESGEPKPAAPVGTAASPPTQPSPVAAAGIQPGGSTTAHHDLPSIDFHTFILSLGSSALLHLGELDQPDGGEARPDLPMAKHTIDIIAMLQEKTKGNLSPPEERLIESLLYDLRLRYVEQTKAAIGG
jgi:Domain of unknown function (DUF1844)